MCRCVFVIAIAIAVVVASQSMSLRCCCPTQSPKLPSQGREHSVHGWVLGCQCHFSACPHPQNALLGLVIICIRNLSQWVANWEIVTCPLSLLILLLSPAAFAGPPHAPVPLSQQKGCANPWHVSFIALILELIWEDGDESEALMPRVLGF